MKLSRLMNQTGLAISAFCMITTTAHASIPAWSVSPIGSPVVTVSATGTAAISYTVTNNSQKPHRLVLSSETPSGISQLGGPCVLAGKSKKNPSPTCTLNLRINGSALPANTVSGGPILCQANRNDTPNLNQCYHPDQENTLIIVRTTAPGATTLSTSIPSPSILALSVNNTTLNAALTGNARQITIKNTGTSEATGVTVSATGLPTGTDITTVPTTCTVTLAANATCTVTITPGQNATSDCSKGIAPTSGTITVNATNVATAAKTNIVVLSYGCQYQGGFVYAVDDTTPNTGSVGGKVVTTSDQAPPYPNGIIWSSNGAGSTGSDVSYDIIPLIAETSTSNDSYATAKSTFNSTYSNTGTFPLPVSSTFATCDGAIQGSCNSDNILALYDAYITGYGITPSPYTLSAGPTSHTDYAAGLCTATINTYSDWYLPAICEMDAVDKTVACPLGVQSMVGNLLFLIGDPSASTPSTSCSPPSGTDCLAGSYWSSTERAYSPQDYAWFEHFGSSGTGGSNQGYFDKVGRPGVRCSRALTP